MKLWSLARYMIVAVFLLSFCLIGFVGSAEADMTTYNFTDGTNGNKAYANGSTGESNPTALDDTVVPGTGGANELSSADYGNISANDGSNFLNIDGGNWAREGMQLEINLTGDPAADVSLINSITLNFSGYVDSTDTVTALLWNYTSGGGTWEYFSPDLGTVGTTDNDYAATFTSADFTPYVSSGLMKVLIHYNRANSGDRSPGVFVDYVDLVIDYTAACDETTTPDNLSITVPNANNATVSGNVTITATADEVMSNMTVSVTGTSGGTCDVSPAVSMSGGSSPWTYSWDTSSCGTSATENPITITVNGDEPECGDTKQAQWTNITIDNTCTPTPGASVAITNPADGGTVTGSVAITATLTNTKNAQYRIDGGTWTDIATAWDTTATHPGSSSAPVTGVTVEVRAIDNADCVYHNDTHSVTVDNRVDTAAGTATAVASGTTSIDVSMPYGADVNNTSTYSVDYKLCSEPSVWTSWVSGAANTPSPYTATVTPLTADGCYDVRMTYLDTADSVSGTAVQTVTGIYLPSENTRPLGATGTAQNSTSIKVSAPFIGDSDNNSTTTFRIATASGGPWTDECVDVSGVSPRVCNVTGLDPETQYWFQIEFTEQGADTILTDVVSNPEEIGPVTTLAAYTANVLIHNSDTITDTTYWSGSWGVPGGQYGPFTCDTCHGKGADIGDNIKRIRTTIISNTVSYNSVTSGNEILGDDSRADNTTSTNVCEVCHSLTSVHRQDMSGLGDPGHGNQQDCMACHPHNQGFKPAGACDLCHDVNVTGWDSAPKVLDKTTGDGGGSYGGHLKATTGDTLSSSTDWEAQCGMCHGMHDGDYLIPYNSTVGIDYTNHGGIWLGGTANKSSLTAGTLAFVDGGAGNDQITDSDNGLAAFKVGQELSIAGSTSNDGTYSVIAVAGDGSTLDVATGSLTTESASASVTLNGKHVTEAEICWGCHDENGISEWGTNTDTNGGESNYNFGQVYTDATMTTSTSRWIGTYWDSANFSYKQGYLNDKPTTADPDGDGTKDTGSTHAAGSSGVAGVDSVSNIRCSYCHNVHNGTNGDGATVGAPFLRGKWMGNPYLEDGAPRSGDSWSNTNNFGDVPRGSATASGGGGYQIDQNNGDPTSTWSADNSSGLCAICHGDGGDTTWAVGTTDGNGDNEIDRIDLFAGNNWVGTNGHSNAVLGGTGNREANIFSMADRNSNPPAQGTGNGYETGNPAMAYLQQTESGAEQYGFRNNQTQDSGRGWDILPATIDRRAFPAASGLYAWGATVYPDSSIDTNYHQFSCSKCHNPHASRLPRLMITNCLDTKNNTWDDGFDQPTGNNGESDPISVDNDSVSISQFTSAQNCHRVKDPSFSNSRGAGWNTITPW